MVFHEACLQLTGDTDLGQRDVHERDPIHLRSPNTDYHDLSTRTWNPTSGDDTALHTGAFVDNSRSHSTEFLDYGVCHLLGGKLWLHANRDTARDKALCEIKSPLIDVRYSNAAGPRGSCDSQCRKTYGSGTTNYNGLSYWMLALTRTQGKVC